MVKLLEDVYSLIQYQNQTLENVTSKVTFNYLFISASAALVMFSLMARDNGPGAEKENSSVGHN